MVLDAHTLENNGPRTTNNAARLDTTTTSRPSPHDGGVGSGQGEGISEERDNLMKQAPLPSALPARASHGEGAEDFTDGGCAPTTRQRALCLPPPCPSRNLRRKSIL